MREQIKNILLNLLFTTSKVKDVSKVKLLAVNEDGAANQNIGVVTSAELKANSETNLSIAQKKRGFDRLDADTMGVPAYDEATQIFTLSVKAGQSYFHFWSNGVEFIKTTTQSKAWGATTGTYYFYFDHDGVLQVAGSHAVTEAIFVTSAICGLVYWNSDSGKAIVQAVDEQHGIIMDASTHYRLHNRTGAVWFHGGDITGLADGSDVFTSVAIVYSFDEDIKIATSGTITSANIPFIYKNGTGGWIEVVNTGGTVGYNGGSGDIFWNEYTGGAWQLTRSLSGTDYVIYYLIWTNDVNNPLKIVIGQQAYANRGTARTALEKELSDINMSGLPSTETHTMYAWIVKRNGDLEDDGSGNDYVDMRHDIIYNA